MWSVGVDGEWMILDVSRGPLDLAMRLALGEIRVDVLALDGDAAAFGFGMRYGYGQGWLRMGFKEDAGFGRG